MVEIAENQGDVLKEGFGLSERQSFLLRERLAEVGAISPNQVAVFTGAGVSVDHPTHAPTGPDLLRAALNHFFLEGTGAEIARAYADMRAITGVRSDAFAGRPRLEAVLEVISTVHGSEALAQIASIFVGKAPNRFHRMLAAHLRLGGQQVTANFDCFVEDTGDSADRGPLHFHGAIRTIDDSLPFGAFLRSIEHGFDKEDEFSFVNSLCRADTRAIVFVGYSFSDYFDVTPALLHAIDRGLMDGKILIWMRFSKESNEVRDLTTDGLEFYPRIIQRALTRQIKVVSVVGVTGDYLYDILDSLGCELDRADSVAPECSCPADQGEVVVGSPTVDPAEATIELLRKFGLLGRLADSENATRIRPDALTGDALAEFAWKRGKYRLALSGPAISDLPAGVHSRLRLMLLQSRIDWIRGRLLRAAILCLKVIREIDSDKTPRNYLLAEALERFGRIAIAMRRSPDTRFLALPLLLRALPEYQARTVSLLASARDVDAVQLAHTEDALLGFEQEFARIPQMRRTRRSSVRQDMQERFVESERLDSFVDYVRASANSGDDWPFPLEVGSSWQISMSGLYRSVGNIADDYRLTLFQPDLRTSLRDGIEACRALDVSAYQKVRFFFYFLLRLAQRRTP